MASDSSRACSSSPASMPRTANLSMIGATSEVTMAATTITVYPVSLRTPRLRPTSATTIPIAPSADNPDPRARPSPELRPDRRAPT